MNEPDTEAAAIIERSIEQSSSSSTSQSSGSSQVLLQERSLQESSVALIELEVMGKEGARSDDDKEDTDGLNLREYFCGFGKCRPKWMQVFRKSNFFTFMLCLNCCIEGALVSG